MTAPLERLLHEGVQAKIFPSASAQVRHQGQVVLHAAAGSSAGVDTVFDLASLTKVMATTAAFLSLWDEGVLEPGTEVARYFPDGPLAQAGATLGDLLFHRSGLPAFRPFFAQALEAFPRLREPGCPALLRDEARRLVVRLAAQTPPERPMRAQALYSDVGFILAGEALAVSAGLPLDQLFQVHVAGPLGLGARFRRLSTFASPLPLAAPTGAQRPREPAPGQEGLWQTKPTPEPPGLVDDDNAWAMDGVSGHAGLFGTAGDVASFGQAVLDGVRGASPLAAPALWAQATARDATTPGSVRALGFDTPSPENSSAGRYLGRRGPRGAVGHVGFTGTSLWVDLDRDLVVALCTNRTYYGRHETRIRDFRPRFHDAVIEELRLQ